MSFADHLNIQESRLTFLRGNMIPKTWKSRHDKLFTMISCLFTHLYTQHPRYTYFKSEDSHQNEERSRRRNIYRAVSAMNSTDRICTFYLFRDEYRVALSIRGANVTTKTRKETCSQCLPRFVRLRILVIIYSFCCFTFPLCKCHLSAPSPLLRTWPSRQEKERVLIPFSWRPVPHSAYHLCFPEFHLFLL